LSVTATGQTNPLSLAVSNTEASRNNAAGISIVQTAADALTVTLDKVVANNTANGSGVSINIIGALPSGSGANRVRFHGVAVSENADDGVTIRRDAALVVADGLASVAGGGNGDRLVDVVAGNGDSVFAI